MAYKAGDINDDAETCGQETFARIWQNCKKKPDPEELFHLRKLNWKPDDPSERALFYFLVNDLEVYHDIDFEQSYLRHWHESGSEALKASISSRIRKNGDARLLSVFKTDRGSRKDSLDEKDVDIQIEILLNNKKFSEAFNLLSQANYAQGRRIINGIRQAGWENTEAIGRELQERLETVIKEREADQNLCSSHAISIFQDFRPMFMGQGKVPQDEKTLLSWIDDKENFRHRSAAIITLAERGHNRLSDVVNKVCTDPYWQVRMAAAGAELLKPGSLSPANRALLEQDHVYWVQALLKMSRSGRLVELGPKALEKLIRAGTRSDPRNKPDSPDVFLELIRWDVPVAIKEYLLTLGEYLGTDSTWSEEEAYDAGEADVEIEFD